MASPLPSPRDDRDPTLQEVIRTLTRVEQLMTERKSLDDEVRAAPSLKDHLLARLQRISDEVNEEQRSVQVLERELTSTDEQLQRTERAIEQLRDELEHTRLEIARHERQLHPHEPVAASSRWARVWPLLGAGLLGTAWYWSSGV